MLLLQVTARRVQSAATVRVFMNALRQSVRGFPLRAVLLAFLLACGCVHPRLPVLPDMSLAGLDTTALKDRIIVIDPGHGGPERGAIGVRGLTEAEVNLTVALHLWGLLKQAGAHPVLTRSADQALHTDAEFDIRRDLGLRAGFAAQAGADLFVSIHHNASLDRSVNALIVFFAMADPYCSLDAARAIGAALQHRLGRDRHSIQPGNYTVLRSSRVPAILGEASFISNKENETDLTFARTLAAEARGYFDGILAYFSRGVPQVSEFSTVVPIADDARPVLRACLDSGHADAQVERGSITTTISTIPVKQFVFEHNCLQFISPELSNGQHRACVAFRTTKGNSARRCIDFRVDLPPGSIQIQSAFPVIPPDPAASTSIDVRVLDRLGRPVIDGTPVAITSTAGMLLQAETVTVNGRARAVLAADEFPGPAEIKASAGEISATAQVLFAVPETALVTVSVRDSFGQPVGNAALLYGETILGRSDSSGVIRAALSLSGQQVLRIERRGFHPCSVTATLAPGAMTNKNSVLQPIDGGVFLNRTIMLDPEGSSPAALPVLELLKHKIEQAGGQALLTWQSAPAPSYQTRVLQASREQADVFLCVRADSRHCRAGHYHRSPAGQSLALHLQEALPLGGFFGRRKCAVRHSTHDTIIQTAMPAIELELPRKLVLKNPEITAQAMYEALRQWLDERSPQTH
jgi:N-acetylmuramoyl-L-alanine amidase